MGKQLMLIGTHGPVHETSAKTSFNHTALGDYPLHIRKPFRYTPLIKQRREQWLSLYNIFLNASPMIRLV